jgi:hypothetical protein
MGYVIAIIASVFLAAVVVAEVQIYRTSRMILCSHKGVVKLVPFDKEGVVRFEDVYYKLRPKDLEIVDYTKGLWKYYRAGFGYYRGIAVLKFDLDKIDKGENNGNNK